MSVQSLINQYGRTVTIASRSNATGAAGGVVVTWTNTTTVTAWVQAASAQEAQLYGADRGRMAYAVYMAGSASVSNTDRLTASIDSETRTLDVLGVIRPGEMAAGSLRHVKVIAQETLPRT